MEDEKKKKRNKKKKGKQAKASEDVKASGGDTTISHHHNHVSEAEQNNISASEHVSQAADAHIAVVVESDARLDNDDDHDRKNVILEERIKQLEIEKNSCIQREVDLEEKAKQLEIEKNSCTQRESGLEKRIMGLEDEKDSWIRREAIMEEKIEQLLNEKSSWSLKQASLENKIKQLESDIESLEKSTEEMIAKLNEDNVGVKLEVKVLQESRDDLLQENQHLMESMSILQSKIQHLEKESSFLASSTKTEKVHPMTNDDAGNAQIEAARALVEKLIIENAELVAKVNELYIELNQQRIPTKHSPKAGSADEATKHSPKAGSADEAVVTINTPAISNDMPELTEKSESVMRMESPALIQNKDLNASLNHTNGQAAILAEIIKEDLSGSYESGENDEIVQIPLDESDIGEVELQPTETNDKLAVSLSDAPLTGAPFRMISFFARYVSGADLVNKSTSSSG